MDITYLQYIGNRFPVDVQMMGYGRKNEKILQSSQCHCNRYGECDCYDCTECDCNCDCEACIDCGDCYDCGYDDCDCDCNCDYDCDCDDCREVDPEEEYFRHIDDPAYYDADGNYILDD